MKLRDSIGTAIYNLKLAKGRTILCTIAVAIGILSVCLIRGLGSCATTLISEELVAIGLRGTTYYIDGPGSFNENAIDAISVFSDVKAVSPITVRVGYLEIRDKRFGSAICGVNQEIADIFSLNILFGRGLSAADLREKSRVIVLDSGTAEKAYGRANIVGKSVEITLGGVSDVFTVIGIVEAQQSGLESLLGESLPSICYAPHTTLNEMKVSQMTMLGVSIDESASDHFRSIISETLRKHTTNSTNVRFQNLDSYEENFVSISNTIAWFITGVAIISAIVAGIGVMNTMLSAVDARTHEIGIYMALGAQKKDLIRNFFLETCLTCLIGGVIGAVGYLGIFVILRQYFSNLIIIEIKQVALGIAVALICGIIFGIMPAIKVSGKDPIEILKAD